MADHMRKQIRAGAVSALTGLATTGARVYATRTDALAATELPGIVIRTESEFVEVASAFGPGRAVQREVDLLVEAIVRENSTYLDTLDQISKEVETVLANNMALGCGAKWISPPQTEIEADGNGSLVVAVAVMTFKVGYITAQNAPDVAL